jgi:hypothetical protein
MDALASKGFTAQMPGTVVYLASNAGTLNRDSIRVDGGWSVQQTEARLKGPFNLKK